MCDFCSIKEREKIKNLPKKGEKLLAKRFRSDLDWDANILASQSIETACPLFLERVAQALAGLVRKMFGRGKLPSSFITYYLGRNFLGSFSPADDLLQDLAGYIKMYPAKNGEALGTVAKRFVISKLHLWNTTGGKDSNSWKQIQGAALVSTIASALGEADCNYILEEGQLPLPRKEESSILALFRAWMDMDCPGLNFEPARVYIFKEIKLKEVEKEFSTYRAKILQEIKNSFLDFLESLES